MVIIAIDRNCFISYHAFIESKIIAEWERKHEKKAFYEKLQKGHKRCKLIVCTVLSDDNYEEGTVIVDRMTYEDCYSAMKNNQEQLTIRQFFKIVEMNWNGKKEVDSWRYYQNGDFIRITDQELCKKLMVSEYSSQVQWQG